MKKNILSLILVSTLSTLSIANAATATATADAQWQATAIKDSKSQLVVVPMDALAFNYAAATKSFNTQKGRFSVDIVSEMAENPGFTLSAQTNEQDNILTRSDATSTTLIVGAKWNNKEFGATPVELIKNEFDLSNPLKTLFEKDSSGANSGRSSALGNFTFYIKQAKDGSNVKNYSELPDGEWTGNATVKFTVKWTQ